MTEQTKKCPFCAEEIQADAIVCRYCHSQISGDNISQLIEMTSKKYKGRMLMALGGSIIGAVVLFIGLFRNSKDLLTIGFLLAMVSFVWFCVTKFKIWWHHG